ncbi:Cis-aconitate decarboxylase [Cercospora beticola]|uniref:Cis-aconitate decarboxylase n=1 Tax=Cercospora beticola TaxID=122368 RepID=A0A2G5I037_CERBT|nr:Cis-aconitate decarboxylase [Cercospora beticola]PIA97842.1 Cis-aconitate decarboxylase [Cercospora beticola]WPA99122.1 hypothetical protein RHO25_003737 [Cercospora beticola]CAK1360433.1 unnamed protein product [Cercospora beticola]
MDASNGASVLPVTKILAAFVASASVEQLDDKLRTKIKEVLIDYIGVAIGGYASADSSIPIYNAVAALQGTAANGSCTVIGRSEKMLPQYAALLNSAFAHSLDFDDTYAEGSLHAGVTTISAVMTQAEVLGESTSIEEAMLAIAVGYEVTCRLGRELGTESYHRGFHNTGTAGIFGAVAAIAVLKHLPPDLVESAFGLAASKAAGSMQYLDNGSWNKRLHPGFAAHDAFICVALAEAGVIGASRSIEGKYGFLQAYSPKSDQDLQRLTAGLGKVWVWLQSSLKPYPACRMTHTFIEMAGKLHSTHACRLSDITAIQLQMPPTNILLVGDPTPNKIHPSNNIDAQFSVFFQVAHALLHGSATGMKAYDNIGDPEVNALCSRTTVSGDPSMTGFSGRMRVQWSDGDVEDMEQQYPLGEEQHPFRKANVDEKFVSLVRPVFGEARADAILSVVEHLQERTIQELLLLLR